MPHSWLAADHDPGLSRQILDPHPIMRCAVHHAVIRSDEEHVTLAELIEDAIHQGINLREGLEPLRRRDAENVPRAIQVSDVGVRQSPCIHRNALDDLCIRIPTHRVPPAQSRAGETTVGVGARPDTRHGQSRPGHAFKDGRLGLDRQGMRCSSPRQRMQEIPVLRKQEARTDEPMFTRGQGCPQTGQRGRGGGREGCAQGSGLHACESRSVGKQLPPGRPAQTVHQEHRDTVRNVAIGCRDPLNQSQ